MKLILMTPRPSLHHVDHEDLKTVQKRKDVYFLFLHTFGSKPSDLVRIYLGDCEIETRLTVVDQPGHAKEDQRVLSRRRLVLPIFRPRHLLFIQDRQHERERPRGL